MPPEHSLPIPSTDVRMRGFARRSTVVAAREWLDGQLPSSISALPGEFVSILEAAGRVLSNDIVSPVDVPQFARSMMDGFAVQSADTLGAAPYNRLSLAIVGESFPGRPPTVAVQSGQAVRIMTGAPLPVGADAVLPAERVDIEGERVLALDEVSPGKHVGVRGEDVAAGATVLVAGRRLRPQDVGVLSSIGLAQVPVVRAPRVRIVITGNELLPPGSTPQGHQIVDANSPMLAALIARDGGLPIHPGIVPDEPSAVLAALRSPADLVVVSGGSSVGREDLAPLLLAEHGELAIHGIAMRPSSPAGLGKLDGKLVFLLPGNPVSCLCAYDFFAGPGIRALAGLARGWPYRVARLPLTRKLVSTVGRVDYARVKLVGQGLEPLAISGASVLTSTTRADGFVVVHEDSEGYAAGSEVEVWLYDALSG